MTEQHADAGKAESWMLEAFGMTLNEYKDNQYGRFPLAYITTAKRIVERSGVCPVLEEWFVEERKGPAGRKADISMQAVLIVLLMHVLDGRGVVFTKMAETLANRLEPGDFALIGIKMSEGSEKEWFHRLWRSAKKLIKLVDSRPAPRHKKLKKNQFAKLLASLDQPMCDLKETRMRWMCNQLVEGSVSLVPREVMRRYKGNLAIDATRVDILGKAGNPGKGKDHKKRRSIDVFAGYWRRGGSHGGTGLRTEIWSYELELGVWVRNTPDGPDEFPLVASAVGFHQPGKVNGEGLLLLNSIRDRGHAIGTLMSDRAYVPSARPEELQAPARAMGWIFVNDYKKTQLGLQAWYEDAILVDGTWYVKYMPQTLIDATKDSRYGRIDKKTRNGRLAARLPYMLRPKGRPDAEGYQRFSYPPVGSYSAVEPVSQKHLRAPKTPSSLTIPPSAGMKYRQHLQYNSKPWKKWYALRNTVESFNKSLKDSNAEGLADPGKRPGRGFTFAFLASTLAVVSANVRKIATFIRSVVDLVPSQPRTRAPRRVDVMKRFFTEEHNPAIPAPPE